MIKSFKKTGNFEVTRNKECRILKSLAYRGYVELASILWSILNRCCFQRFISLEIENKRGKEVDVRVRQCCWVLDSRFLLTALMVGVLHITGFSGCQLYRQANRFKADGQTWLRKRHLYNLHSGRQKLGQLRSDPNELQFAGLSNLAKELLRNITRLQIAAVLPEKLWRDLVTLLLVNYWSGISGERLSLFEFRKPVCSLDISLHIYGLFLLIRFVFLAHS